MCTATAYIPPGWDVRCTFSCAILRRLLVVRARVLPLDALHHSARRVPAMMRYAHCWQHVRCCWLTLMTPFRCMRCRIPATRARRLRMRTTLHTPQHCLACRRVHPAADCFRRSSAGHRRTLQSGSLWSSGTSKVRSRAVAALLKLLHQDWTPADHRRPDKQPDPLKASTDPLRYGQLWSARQDMSAHHVGLHAAAAAY